MLESTDAVKLDGPVYPSSPTLSQMTHCSRTASSTLPGTHGRSRYGAHRNGTPFINAQPRFGIYRDRRAETQTVYFNKIMFWNADPSGHPD